MEPILLNEEDEGKVFAEILTYYGRTRTVIKIYELDGNGEEQFAYTFPADYIDKIVAALQRR